MCNLKTLCARLVQIAANRFVLAKTVYMENCCPRLEGRLPYSATPLALRAILYGAVYMKKVVPVPSVWLVRNGANNDEWRKSEGPSPYGPLAIFPLVFFAPLPTTKMVLSVLNLKRLGTLYCQVFW